MSKYTLRNQNTRKKYVMEKELRISKKDQNRT